MLGAAAAGVALAAVGEALLERGRRALPAAGVRADGAGQAAALALADETSRWQQQHPAAMRADPSEGEDAASNWDWTGEAVEVDPGPDEEAMGAEGRRHVHHHH